MPIRKHQSQIKQRNQFFYLKFRTNEIKVSLISLCIPSDIPLAFFNIYRFNKKKSIASTMFLILTVKNRKQKLRNFLATIYIDGLKRK